MAIWGEPSGWALLLAFAVDQLWGEVPSAVHPVVWMGRMAAALSRPLRAASPAVALLGGACVALSVPLAFGLGAAWLLERAPEGWPKLLLEAALLTTTFAVRALGEAVQSLGRALQGSGLEEGRVALRALCSRDASELGPSQLSAAAIESAAENASDSFVAPLFYYTLFGLPGAVAYRAINTLDAMLGYRGQLEYLGKAAARLDDVANWLPARCSAAILLFSSLRPRRAPQALAVWWQDARRTESPNAGHPMAMMAGLLGVRLAKPGAYELGAGQRSPSVGDIVPAWRIVARAGWLSLGLSLVALWGRR